ncbi:MAG: YqgE/AlgH family protein [Pseudomonadota bacterium]
MTSFLDYREGTTEGSLEGHFLIAMPSMDDTRFRRTLIYLCAHSSSGAMGIIINQLSPHIRFPELLAQLQIIPEMRQDRLPAELEAFPVLQGGPVEQSRGFVLHSADYTIDNATIEIGKGICLTATLDILKAIATREGPRKALLALGYAGWRPGQLEAELQDNAWLHGPAEAELIFETNLTSKYTRALNTLGIDPAFLSGEAGHA